MFNAAPSSWIPGYTSDGTHITIPIASIPPLVAGDADAATGDVRKVVYALCAMLAASWQTEGTGNQPGKMTISSGQALNGPSNTITANYQFSFNLTPSSLGVTPES